MNRRDFLQKGALLAGAMCLDWKGFAATVSQLGKPKLTIGVISDIHIKLPEQVGTLEKTYQYFRDRGVDGVIMAGDLADDGMEHQLKLVADTWYRVFPKDKLPSGRKVTKLFVYGNHDMDGHTYGYAVSKFTPEVIAAEAIRNRKAEIWQKYFHEKFQQVYIKDVKGYKFIGAHWGNHNTTPGAVEFIEAHKKELQGTKPFFYFQHPHPRNTCGGTWAWGQDDGSITQELSKFPNCVAFSGHSHNVLNDERSIWQGAFTSINTSSLSYTYTLGGRENVYVDGDPEPNTPYQMPQLTQADGKQGMIMTVYDNCITLERREFVYDESLGDNWIIPLPAPGNKPFSFDYRSEHEAVPQFQEGDKVTVTRAKGKDRYGVEQMQTTAHFPNVLKKRGGVRAFDFEVGLELHEVDVYRMSCVKRVMSPCFYLGEGKDSGEVTCVFGEHEAPRGREVRFHVRPCNCWGKKGNEIVSDWFKIS